MADDKRIVDLLDLTQARVNVNKTEQIFGDRICTLRWDNIPEEIAQAMAAYELDNRATITDQTIDFQLLSGVWRSQTVWLQKNPQQTITLFHTFALGYLGTLETVAGSAIDFNTARLSAPGNINHLGEMFTCEFVNLDPAKLNDMLTELNDHVPYTDPVIQGNTLTGSYLPISIRASQAADGSGVIILKSAKGGRNFGAITSLAAMIKVWTEGNVSFTQYAYYYRQTATEITALLVLLSALTTASGTAGISIEHQLSEVDEGGPYNLTVRAHTTGNQTALGYRKTLSENTVITEQLSTTQPAEPAAAGSGVTTDLDVTPTGDGKFKTRATVKTEAETLLSEVTKIKTALGDVTETENRNTAAAASDPASAGQTVSNIKTPGGRYIQKTRTETATGVSTGWVDHPGRWGTDYMLGFSNKTIVEIEAILDTGATPMIAGMDISMSALTVNPLGLYSGVIQARTPPDSTKPASDWANFSIKTWTDYRLEHHGNGLWRRFLKFERGLIHSSLASTCKTAIDGQDNAEILPINGGKHFEGRYCTLKAEGTWETTGTTLPTRP